MTAKRMPKGCTLSIAEEGNSIEEVFYVRVSAVPSTLDDIATEAGASIGDTNGGSICKKISVKAVDDSGLLYEVSVSYEPKDKKDGNDPNDGEDGELPSFVWAASGSTSTVPVWREMKADGTEGDVITNSADDPLEGLEKEKSEFALTLTMPFATHGAFLSVARKYTDSCNNGSWNGGAQHTWLCRFRSASVERKSGLVYWSTQWEFAYREETWRLKPWDVGFHEFSGSPGAGDFGKKVIVGSDGKPVKQPVALSGGTKLPAGSKPVVINGGDGVKVYRENDFNAAFGQMFTPRF